MALDDSLPDLPPQATEAAAEPDPAPRVADQPDLAGSALLTIDVQNDFVLAGSPVTIPGSAEVVPAVAQVVQAYRAAGLPVIHVVRLYLADGSNAEPSRRQLAASDRGVVRPGTEGSQLVEALRPVEAWRLDPALLLEGGLQVAGEREWAMYKPRWGAFYRTRLDEMLRSLGVGVVVVVGVNFPNCPRTTLYEASERDYHPVLVADAVSQVYRRGLGECAGIGATVTDAAGLVARVAAREPPGAVGAAEPACS